MRLRLRAGAGSRCWVKAGAGSWAIRLALFPSSGQRAIPSAPSVVLLSHLRCSWSSQLLSYDSWGWRLGHSHREPLRGRLEDRQLREGGSFSQRTPGVWGLGSGCVQPVLYGLEEVGLRRWSECWERQTPWTSWCWDALFPRSRSSPPPHHPAPTAGPCQAHVAPLRKSWRSVVRFSNTSSGCVGPTLNKE